MQNLTPEIAESLGIDPKTKGVVVAGVEPGSPADDAGLQRGDVILEVNRQPVENEDAYKKAVKKVEKGKSVLLLVRRGDNTIFLALKPPKEMSGYRFARRGWHGGPESRSGPPCAMLAPARSLAHRLRSAARRRGASRVGCVAAHRATAARSSTRVVVEKFDGRRWDFPSRIYSDAFLLYPGLDVARGRARRAPAAARLSRRRRRRAAAQGRLPPHAAAASTSSCATSPIRASRSSERAGPPRPRRRRRHRHARHASRARSSTRCSSSRSSLSGLYDTTWEERRVVHARRAAAAAAARGPRHRGPPLLSSTTASIRSASLRALVDQPAQRRASSRAAARSRSS